MNHQHNWQFNRELTTGFIFNEQTQDYDPAPNKFHFVCECGKSKIVEEDEEAND